MRRKTKKQLSIITAVVIIVLIGIALIWSQSYYRATDRAKLSLESDNTISVQRDKYIVFTPKVPTKKGFIFYPGGKVEEEAYAYLCKEIAKQGYKVVIVPMPFKLAILDKNEAKNIINTYGEIETWAIGGHSLGGVMAASFAAENPELVKGLVLYAAYPMESDDLSNQDLNVLSIYGDLDGVLNLESFNLSKKNLPKTTSYILIEGGNHSGFGDYGLQEGDKASSITYLEQQKQIVQYTIRLLESK